MALHVHGRRDDGTRWRRAARRADRLRLPGGDGFAVVHHGARDPLPHAYGVLPDAVDRAGAQALGPVVEWYPAEPGPVTAEISCRTRRG